MKENPERLTNRIGSSLLEQERKAMKQRIPSQNPTTEKHLYHTQAMYNFSGFVLVVDL